MAAIKPRAYRASDEPCDAEGHQRHGDDLLVHTANLQQERLDIAITRVVPHGVQSSHDEDAHEHLVPQNAGKLFEREGLAGRDLREHHRQVRQHQRTYNAHAAEGLAPAQPKPHHATKRQPNHHGKRRAGDHGANGHRRVPLVDDFHRHGSCNGPEHRMGAGDHQTRCHEQTIAGRQGRKRLPGTEHADDQEHKRPKRQTGTQYHEGKRQQHDRPGVHRDDQPRHALARPERGADAGQEADGHELRSIEYERGNGDADQGQPFPQRKLAIHKPCHETERFLPFSLCADMGL